MPAPPATVDTLVIGAGLAGLSCALHLGRAGADVAVLEAADHVGGKARTERRDGFTFDVTGHWLHLRDPAERALVLDLCGEDHFMQVSRMSRIWSHGAYTRYPFQANLYGLPPEVVAECIMGAVEADRRRPEPGAPEPENFADWIRAFFGEGIAEHFMVPYNAKLWGVPAERITSRWCQRFVPKPALADIVAGAVGCNEKAMGYNAVFLYSREGGIQSVAERLADAAGRERIFLERRVASVDPVARVATLSDGHAIRYRRLVNTAPLTRFVDSLGAAVPAEVRAAREKLWATEVVYLNVGVRGPVGQPDHWIYVPERRWPMYRVGSFSNANPAMAPEGCASLYVEMSDRDTPTEDLLPTVYEGLIQMGLIASADQIAFADVRRIPDAYVVYDFDYHHSRAAVHAWLSTQGLRSIGRYGDWNYSSMEDALMEGRRAASALLEEEPG